MKMGAQEGYPFSRLVSGDVAEWLRRSVSNLVRSTRVGSNPRRRNH